MAIIDQSQVAMIMKMFHISSVAIFATVLQITPLSAAPAVNMKDSYMPTYGLIQEDSVFGHDIGVLKPVFNSIASLIASRLINDPDPTSLETAGKYIKKAKDFIEPVSKFVSRNNKDSKGVMNVLQDFFSTLEQMIGSDEDETDLPRKLRMMQTLKTF